MKKIKLIMLNSKKKSNIFNNINTLNLLVQNKNQPTDMFNINKILMAEPANLINNLFLY